MTKIVIYLTDGEHFTVKLDQPGISDSGLIIKALHKLWEAGFANAEIIKIEINEVE